MALAALAVVLAGANCYETLRRSTIPSSLDGTAEALDVRFEKEPGIDDVHLLTIDGDVFHVDARVAGAVRPGDRVRKDAWSRTLLVDGEPHRLGLSRDAVGMLFVMPLVLLVVGVLLRSRWKEPDGPDEGPTRATTGDRRRSSSDA
ncbi:MAG TPA: hypothetical protein VHN37_09135 [Actinomycetota bacterium]|nr:hypothetical protein [Actinomycetota bacterium]